MLILISYFKLQHFEKRLCHFQFYKACAILLSDEFSSCGNNNDHRKRHF